MSPTALEFQSETRVEIYRTLFDKVKWLLNTITIIEPSKRSILMRRLYFHSFLLLGFLASAQEPQTKKSERGSLQLEVGFFGDFFHKRISGPQMEMLSGKPLPEWAPQSQVKLSESSTSDINAGYYTLSYQKPIRSTGYTWWSAGISFLVRSVAECVYSTDSVNLRHTIISPGDTLFFKESKTWLGSATIRGSQLNVPIGIRFMNSDQTKRWISFGVNLAPGLIFNHQYFESLSIVSATAVVEPWGNRPYERVENDSENEYTKTKLPGLYFTSYAGTPVTFCFNPVRKWQFTLSFEPGYSATWLGHGITSGAVMMRMGFGVKFVI